MEPTQAQIMFQGERVIATITRRDSDYIRFTVPHLTDEIVWTAEHFRRATNAAYDEGDC